MSKLRHWKDKFRYALRGIQVGIEGQSSFHIHLPVAVAVLALAGLLRCELYQWCLLGLCIGLVLAAELANSAVEYLARGLCREQNAEIGKALDVASAAVLVAALTAACIGAAIFTQRLWQIWNGF